MLPFPPRACSPEYMGINPLGTVPAYIDGTTRMTESSAICEFIAMRHSLGDLAVAPDESEYGEYLNWVHFGEATLTFPQTLVLRYGRFEPIDRQLPQVVQDYSRWFLSRLRGVERKILSHRYLCADRFTVADISVGYALMLAGGIPGLERPLPRKPFESIGPNFRNGTASRKLLQPKRRLLLNREYQPHPHL